MEFPNSQSGLTTEILELQNVFQQEALALSKHIGMKQASTRKFYVCNLWAPTKER